MKAVAKGRCARKPAKPAFAPRKSVVAREIDTPRKELVREQLIDIAAQLFERNGYAQTSLGDIAGEIGLGRSAIYHYFSSKEEILAMLVENGALKPATDLDALMREPGLSPRERIRRAIVGGIERRLRQGARFLTLIHLEAQIPRELQAIYNDSRRKIHAFYAACIADGIRSGDFYDTDPKIAAFAVIGMANWTSRWYSPSGSMPPEEIAAAIADLAIQGLSATPAPRASSEICWDCGTTA